MNASYTKRIFAYSKNLLAFICLGISLLSCSENSKKVDTIVLHQTTVQLAQSEVYSPLEWIQLDDSLECTVGGCRRIIEDKDKLYLLENKYQNCVLVFNNKGKFIRKIGSRGQGPGEYSNPVDFALDKQSGKITILCDPSTVYQYDSIGNFVTSKKLDETLLHRIVHTSSGYVASTDHFTYTEGDNAFLLYWFDDNFNIIGKAIPVLEEQIFTLPHFNGQLAIVGDKAYYNDLYTCKIYDCTTYKSHKEIFEYSLSNQMPIKKYLGMDYFENQTNYDHTLSIINLPDGIAVTAFMTGILDEFIINSDGTVRCAGTVMMPSITFHGNNNTLLSPISTEEYFSQWENSVLKPSNEIRPDDNLILLRWKING